MNPLLNASVTGGTVEDFSQNALLLPAATVAPVQPPPPPQVQRPPTFTPPQTVPNSDINIAPPANAYNYPANNLPPRPSSAPYFNPALQQQPQQGGAILEEYPLTQEVTYQQPYIPQYNQNLEVSQPPPPVQQESAGLQSVFSSFSSYLKLGGSAKPQEEQQQVIPSVVDSVLSGADPNAAAAPVQFYSPTDSFPTVSPPLIPPATSNNLSSNTYRRGGLKRPTYAPIPGLTSGSSIAPPQIPASLPQQPPLSHSPLAPFIGSPLQTTVSSDLPPIVYPPFPPPSQLQQLDRIKDTLKNTASPFLSPVADPEEIQFATGVALKPLANPPIANAPYYPATTGIQTTHSLFNPPMSASESPRASPNLASNYKMDSVDRPILTSNETTFLYRPVYHHWFFKKVSDTKTIWTPFSMQDSLNLEAAYLSPNLSPDEVVSTDGGRFDVNILLRQRVPVYWEGQKSEVRRCSWFHKGSTDGRYAPYEENIATMLEEEFKIAFEANTWNRKVDLPNGESVVFHGPDVLVLFPATQSPDSWGNTSLFTAARSRLQPLVTDMFETSLVLAHSVRNWYCGLHRLLQLKTFESFLTANCNNLRTVLQNQPRPRVVKRGLDEFHIEEGEPPKVDHVLFLVHGIGSVCDLKFRAVEEVVDEFRNIALQLVQSHYRSSCEQELANRIEVLPVSWHGKLHSEDTGVDRKMKGITLESIPRLRDFTNDTILDVLFYTSPVYCQTIVSSVGNELNRIYDLFKQRNPTFTGGVSLGGHSLGSLILFDLLCHQHPTHEKKEDANVSGEDELSPLKPAPNLRKMSRRISYMMGQMGTGQPQINYPNLTFSPCHFFALGSPVGMFVTVRGLDTLGEQFSLPTCPAYYNIFHPYDPVAYRIEPLVNPELTNLKPVLIPHHKGRKRMHLELKETMARVGADLKQKLIDSMKSTWNSFYQFTLFKGQTNTPNLEEEVDKVLEEQLSKDDNVSDEENIIEAEPTDLALGILNQGRRVDYVLQEAPLEFFNDYIFALTSHVCYWESEDTILLIVKEIYNSKNISADSQIPQQTMKIERTTSSSTSSCDADVQPTRYGVDPTAPMSSTTNVGPPPLAGFVRKS